ETMGEVVEVGSAARNSLKKGDRVVIPFTIVCGECDQCRAGNFSGGRRTNRNKERADKACRHAAGRIDDYRDISGVVLRAKGGGRHNKHVDRESPRARRNELTGGEGPPKCIDAVGMEAHISLKHPDAIIDRAKQMLMMESDRPHVLREMIYVCRPAGVISVIGV